MVGTAPRVDNGAMPQLPDAEIATRLGRLPGWEREGDEIVRTFELPSFPEAIAFVGRVAERAEAVGLVSELSEKMGELSVAKREKH